MSDERTKRLNRIADLAAIETARDLLADAAILTTEEGGLRNPGETQAAAHMRIVASFDRECPRDTAPIIGRADLQFAELAAMEARRRNLATLALVGIAVAIVALAVAL